jgi:hypothetical protein
MPNILKECTLRECSSSTHGSAFLFPTTGHSLPFEDRINRDSQVIDFSRVGPAMRQNDSAFILVNNPANVDIHRQADIGNRFKVCSRGVSYGVLPPNDFEL